ncbi:LysE family translocator [Paenibacillus sp. MER TA 81-3]|uniref:LysE family translocator n=1 Tax=Paenibacillus sp. MER TA 81-3 TaxID=2939573 RepID=UPI00203A5116|nr:LysE family translocator [Paenibacillus sp. MER TA 81-3]MCM3341583.1 LysE family translocator [Paenibacillus sp. MER TA 81-3]
MEQFTMFLMMSVALILTPGADTALVTKSTIVHGKREGIATAAGTAAGIIIHTCAAALGLSVLLAQSAVLYETVKWAGAVYLIYLGISSLLSKGSSSGKAAQPSVEDADVPVDGSSVIKCFSQGVLTNVLNPKVALFFLTFLPQFVRADSASFTQYLTMGLIYAFLLIVWLLIFVYFIHAFRSWLQKPSVHKTIERVTGVVLIGFGLKVALEQRP